MNDTAAIRRVGPTHPQAQEHARSYVMMGDIARSSHHFRTACMLLHDARPAFIILDWRVHPMKKNRIKCVNLTGAAVS